MMNVNAGIFKAYDIRGVYPEELNEDVAYAIGRAFSTFLKVKTVIVGRDMRLSSPSIFDAVTRGLMDQGTDVINIGMVSTDQYYYACATLKQAGMMVTASHNPAQYSGFKMVKSMPHLLSGDEGIQDLLRIVQNDDFAPKPDAPGTMTEQDLSEGFIEMALSLIDVNALANFKVIADTGNGMVGPILKRVFDRIPSVDLTGMYLDPDGRLPNHGLDPLQPENRAELQQRVVDENADIGFAFDGDGDRFFTIDDRGNFVSGDFLTALLGRYFLKKHGQSKIVYDVRASWAVENLVQEAGGSAIMSRVGHAFFKKVMSEHNAIFGGEVTGHYYFKDFFFADSGIIPALFILEMLTQENTKLSDLLIELEKEYFISGEINSRIDGDAKAKMEELVEAFGDGGRVTSLDGISVDFEDWHFNVRASNTEPLLRLNLEAKSKELMEQKRDEVLAIIRG